MRAALPRELAILLAGSVVLAGWSAVRLPPAAEIFRRPQTPYDRSGSGAADFRFLTEAASRIPRRTSVIVWSEPRDPTRETTLYISAVALLPGRRVLPAAQWNIPTPEWEAEAQYVLVFGPSPHPSPGESVAVFPGGSIFRRPSR